MTHLSATCFAHTDTHKKQTNCEWMDLWTSHYPASWKRVTTEYAKWIRVLFKEWWQRKTKYTREGVVVVVARKVTEKSDNHLTLLQNIIQGWNIAYTQTWNIYHTKLLLWWNEGLNIFFPQVFLLFNVDESVFFGHSSQNVYHVSFWGGDRGEVTWEIVKSV